MALNTENQAALQGIFLAQGFGAHSNEASVTFGGNYGVSEWLSQYAGLIGAVVSANDVEYRSDDDAYDDVFEYQVTAGMGKWLASNLHATPAEFCVELKSSCDAFFKRSCDYLNPVIDGYMANFDVIPRAWRESGVVHIKTEGGVAVDTSALTTAIALAFLSDLQKAVPFRYAECCVLNRKEVDPNICHSHDFIDANMIMAAAMKRVTGVDVDVQNEAQRATWNTSWNTAKKVMAAATAFDFDSFKDELGSELDRLLLNWNDSTLSVDGEKIITYPDRNGAGFGGAGSQPVVIPHQELFDWLASSAPLHASVYAKNVEQGESWELLVTKARTICGISPEQSYVIYSPTVIDDPRQSHDAPG